MKMLTTAVFTIAMAAGACGAAEFDLNSLSAGQVANLEIAVPAAKALPANPGQQDLILPAFRTSVKQMYEQLALEYGTLTALAVAQPSELPLAARQQLEKDNREWGPAHPSIPYIMLVHGYITFVIHNENDLGIFVNIFADDGTYIAGGGRPAGGKFSWNGGAKGITADTGARAPVTAGFKKAVKKEYSSLYGNGGLGSLPVAKTEELPPAAGKQLEKDDREFPDFRSIPRKMTVQGSVVFVIQNDNDGGMFAHIFSADGELIASASQSESGDCFWI